MPISLRLPADLPPAPTGDAVLDAWYRNATDPDHKERVSSGPIDGAGMRCAPMLVEALYDHGETVWDDDAARSMPRAELARARADADRIYRSGNLRTAALRQIADELVASNEGQRALRASLAWQGDSRAIGTVVAVLQEAGGEENVRAIADAPITSGALLRPIVAARISLDPSAAAGFLRQAAEPECEDRSPIIRGLLSGGFVPQDDAVELLISLIFDPGVWEPIAELLDRVPATNDLLERLLRMDAPSVGLAAQLARFDEPRALEALVRIGAQTTLANSEIEEAMEASHNPLSASLAQQWAAAVEAAGARKAVVKRRREFAAELASKHGVKLAPLPKVKAKPVLPPEPWPDAPPFAQRESMDAPAVQAEIAAALTAAGLGSRQDLIARGAIVAARRTSEGLAPLASRLGGLPALDDASSWPARKGVPLSFVGQIRLGDLASTCIAGELPQDGLLSFFINNEGADDDYCCAGAVLYFTAEQLPQLAVAEPPAAFQKFRAGRPARQPYPPCSVEFVDFVTCVDPSNPRVKLKGDSAARYAAIAEQYPVPFDNLLLGTRPGYDGETKASDRLLFFVTSDDQAAFEFGDVDAVSFVISAASLSKRDFTKVKTWVGEG